MAKLVYKMLTEGSHYVPDLNNCTRMNSEFLAFARAVIKKIPSSYLIVHGINSHSAYVAIDGYPFIVGDIYTSFTYRGSYSAKTTYNVRSDNIYNQRGSDRTVKESISLKTGVKNASTYCRPNQLGAGILDLVCRAESAMNTTNHAPFRRFRESEKNAFGDAPNDLVIQELVSLYEREAHFKSQALYEQVAEYVNAKVALEEFEDTKSTEAVAMLVGPDRHGDIKKCYLAPLTKKGKSVIRNYSMKVDKEGKTMPIVEVSPDNLPEVIQAAMPMLDMVEPHSYIEDIGVKEKGGFYLVEIHND